MTDVETEIKLRIHLRIEQAQWLTLWQQCADFCMPQMSSIVRNSLASAVAKPTWNPQRQNSVAMEAVNTLAGGCKNWIMPGGGEGWGGQWEPHPVLSRSTAVKDWLAEATATSIPILENGGFFNAAHQTFAGLGVFGTFGIMIDESVDRHIACHALPPSDFVFQRGWDDDVTRVIITYRKSAQELVDTFGEENVPECVTRDIRNNKPNEQHEVFHSIHRRTDAKAKYKDDPMGFPVASCWVHVEGKKALREGGFHEFPFVVPRWLKWGGSSPFGTSPAMQALADIRGVNLFDMLTATAAELQVNPRLKIAAGHTGAIDLSPGGVTQMSGIDSVQEWATQGRFDVGEAITLRKEQQIRTTFHTDLFRALSPIARERELTNYVAQALEREAAANISPAMGQMTTDLITPGMSRTFMLLYRAGVFGEAPEEAFYYDGSGQRFFLLPKIAQTSRMSEAMNSRKTFAFNNAMARAVPLVPFRPDILDIYDFEQIARDLDRGDGMPASWHLDEKALLLLRENRRRDQERQLAQQTAADAMSNHPKEVAELAQGGMA